MLQTQKCLYCLKEFNCHKWENRKYCSVFCAGKQNQNCIRSKSWTKKSKKPNMHTIICDFCKISILTNRRKYCSATCSRKARWSLCKESHKIARKHRGLSRKLKMIEYKGGKCENCGYNKCIRALTFHHKNSNQKSFTLDQRNMSQKTYDEIKTEIDKCELLCFNCHMEHHYNND